MELYYKVIKIEKANGIATPAYEKEFKASEPLFARRAAIAEADKLKEAVAANADSNAQAMQGLLTIIVALCFPALEGFVSELPVHFAFGNEELSLLTHHSWPLEAGLYYQYQCDTGGNITTYMDVLVLPDVMEQVLEDHF
jgi:hypothetical protein